MKLLSGMNSAAARPESIHDHQFLAAHVVCVCGSAGLLAWTCALTVPTSADILKHTLQRPGSPRRAGSRRRSRKKKPASSRPRSADVALATSPNFLCARSQISYTGKRTSIFASACPQIILNLELARDLPGTHGEILRIIRQLVQMNQFASDLMRRVHPVRVIATCMPLPPSTLMWYQRLPRRLWMMEPLSKLGSNPRTIAESPLSFLNS